MTPVGAGGGRLQGQLRRASEFRAEGRRWVSRFPPPATRGLSRLEFLRVLTMLRELHISNLAVISDVRIELDPGLNCFTGATGAGKSLVIGALEVLLGLRSPARCSAPAWTRGASAACSRSRTPTLLARSRKSPTCTSPPTAANCSSPAGSTPAGEARSASTATRSRWRCSKQVAEALVDVHGQHDHQYLLKPTNQLDVLDQFGDLWPLRPGTTTSYESFSRAKRRLADLVRQPDAARAAVGAVPVPGRRDRRRRAGPGGIRRAGGPRVGPWRTWRSSRRRPAPSTPRCTRPTGRCWSG